MFRTLRLKSLHLLNDNFILVMLMRHFHITFYKIKRKSLSLNELLVRIQFQVWFVSVRVTGDENLPENYRKLDEKLT